MTKIIALHGYSHTGKDEVGRVLVEQGYTRVAKGDLIKDAALQINPFINETHGQLSVLVKGVGWEKAKRFAEVRVFLQRLPDSVVAACGRDVWNDAVYRQIEGLELDRVVMTRICLVGEALAVKAHGGEVWLVRRPGVGPVNDSANEHGLDGWYSDKVIDNDGSLDDLKAKVLRALAPSRLK